jgi:simple sugar transport system permease protein
MIMRDVAVEQPRRTLRLTRPMIYLGIAGFLLLLSLVRVITGVEGLTSSGQVGATLALAVPFGMAGLGGLWAERAGVVNIGLEGMMIFGTWGAGWAGYQWGGWAGVAAGVAFGALGGLLHALTTVTFGVDHVVSGVAISILAAGLAQYLSAVAFEGVPGGGPTQSPPISPRIGTVTIPWLADAMGDIEEQGWFFVSDLAGIVRGLTYQVSWLTVVAVALLPISFFLLWRTSFGLRLRSCGESPHAAESLGVNVYLMKYVAVIASGAFAGLGGAFLAVVSAGIYREGQTGGRGYIGLAAMIFGNWRPGGLAMGAGLFGYTDALQLRGGGESVHALLLLVVLLAAGAAALSFARGRVRAGAASAVVAGLVLAWYLSTDTVPRELATITPHFTTLLVLALASQRLRMPAADGLVYRRGEAG